MEGDALLGQLSPLSGSHLTCSLCFPKVPSKIKDKKGTAQLCCAPLLGTWNSCSRGGEDSSGLRWQITLKRSHTSEQCPSIPLILPQQCFTEAAVPC